MDETHVARTERLARQAVEAIVASLKDDPYLHVAWDETDSEVQRGLKRQWQEYIERLFL